MKPRSKKIIYALFMLAVFLSAYLLWLSFRPVAIVAVHHGRSGFSDVLVKNFPFTDKGKIHWWLKNKAILKEKHSIPNPEKDGFFYLTFWSFGDGYKEEEKYDRLCFDDMKTKVNCIEKDPVFSVKNSKNMGTIFKAYDGTYRLQENGEIVKYDDHFEAW